MANSRADDSAFELPTRNYEYQPILPADNPVLRTETGYRDTVVPLPTTVNSRSNSQWYNCKSYSSNCRIGFLIIVVFVAVILVVGLTVKFTKKDRDDIGKIKTAEDTFEKKEEQDFGYNENSPSSYDEHEGHDHVIRTEKCDEEQLIDFAADRVECYERAHMGLELALAARNDITAIKKALCLSIGDKVKCNTVLGPRCFNSTQTQNLISNYLFSEFEKAHNLSHILGQDFIQACSILRDNEKSVVFAMADSSVCTFTEYITAFHEWKDCRDRAIEHNTEKMRSSNIVSMICTLRRDHDACYPDIMRCAGGNSKKVLIEQRDEFVDSLLKLMNKNGKTFSFEKSC